MLVLLSLLIPECQTQLYSHDKVKQQSNFIELKLRPTSAIKVLLNSQNYFNLPRAAHMKNYIYENGCKCIKWF